MENEINIVNNEHVHCNYILCAHPSPAELRTVLEEIIAAIGCDMERPAHVVVARDTR